MGIVGKGKRRHFLESCDKCAFGDVYKDAFLKQQNERIDEKKTAGKGREPKFVREQGCQKPTPGFMVEVDVQIRKRKKLLDQFTSMSDVWKKIEYAEFGAKPWEFREERWNRVRQKGMTLFTTMSELWSQKELSHVGGREALTKVHKQMIILTDQMHQKHRRDRWKHKVEKLQESCKAGSSLLFFEWIRMTTDPRRKSCSRCNATTKREKKSGH